MTKMLQGRADCNRVIDAMPPPFLGDVTPYKLTDFHECVKNAVNANSTKQSNKMSKMIVLGDMGTGKTCLVRRFCHRLFDILYKTTIGVDFEVERFCVLGVPFDLQIWDTAGHERFKCIAASYYRGANAVILVFDVMNLVTLAHTAQWLEEVRNANPNTDPLVFLVAAKRDLVSNSTYGQIESEAKRVALNMGAEYWTVSAKTGERVDSLFLRLAALAFNRSVLQELRGAKKMSLLGTIQIGRSLGDSDTYEKMDKHKCSGCSGRNASSN